MKIRLKMHRGFRVLAVFFITALLANSVSAQDEEGLIPKIWKRLTAKKGAVSDEKKSTPVFNKSVPPMAKEEMVRQIKYEIEGNEEILKYVTELKKRNDKDGKEFYAYADGKQEIRLEDLDAERLKRTSE